VSDLPKENAKVDELAKHVYCKPGNFRCNIGSAKIKLANISRKGKY
jgi:hypothetical protein